MLKVKTFGHGYNRGGSVPREGAVIEFESNFLSRHSSTVHSIVAMDMDSFPVIVEDEESHEEENISQSKPETKPEAEPELEPAPTEMKPEAEPEPKGQKGEQDVAEESVTHPHLSATKSILEWHEREESKEESGMDVSQHLRAAGEKLDKHRASMEELRQSLKVHNNQHIANIRACACGHGGEHTNPSPNTMLISS